MRNLPIHVERPYGASHTAYARMGGGFGGRPQGRLVNALVAQDGSEIARPALQGLAALYGVPFVPTVKGASGLRFRLQAGALDIAAVRLLVDHDDQNLHGSTGSGLTLASSSYGVAFRFPLTPDNGLVLSALVASGGRDAVSVGLDDIYGFTDQDEDGDIFVITKAKLTEISLVKSGACAAAFASVVDLDNEMAELRDTLDSPGFRFDRLAASSARLERLSARVRRLEREIEGDADTMGEWSLAASNRHQTEVTASLQEWALAHSALW
ncbi:HK97 family phage prohead protease [Devosia sp. A16]|uniref:HK97 family phage prohead protease n=1 Tax=Devosia sp. A16 TaxID=1736675 RepID=UPI0006D81253|nr:HK97 family phage prohead protease [Devosia sp. A16]